MRNIIVGREGNEKLEKKVCNVDHNIWGNGCPKSVFSAFCNSSAGKSGATKRERGTGPEGS